MRVRTKTVCSRKNCVVHKNIRYFAFPLPPDRHWAVKGCEKVGHQLSKTRLYTCTYCVDNKKNGARILVPSLHNKYTTYSWLTTNVLIAIITKPMKDCKRL